MRPLVSLSSRWTRPGRMVPPTVAMPGAWASSACASVPVFTPAPGWTTSPGGLSRTRMSSSWKTTDSGRSSGTSVAGSASGRRACTSAPARTGSDAFAARPSTVTCPAAMSAWMRLRVSSGQAEASTRSSRPPRSSSVTRCWSVRLMRGLDRCIAPEDQRGGEEDDADRDRRVGGVEDREHVAPVTEVDEVDDRAPAHAVEQVSRRAADDEPEREAAQPRAVARREGEDDDEPERDGGDGGEGQALSGAQAEGDAGVAHVGQAHPLADQRARVDERQLPHRPRLGPAIEREDERGGDPHGGERRVPPRGTARAQRRPAFSSRSLHLMQSRAWGTTSRRAAAIGRPHDSHMPYSPP